MMTSISSIKKSFITSTILFAFTSLIPQLGFGQNIYLTSSGGNYASEKWMSITTGPNGTGTVVWAQGNGSYGNGQGLVNDQLIDVSAYCGSTLYVNAYDRYDDSWDGTIYEIWTGSGQSGTLLANNSGVSPDSGDDNDCSGSGWCITDPGSELEISESFSAPACPCTAPSASFNVIPDCINGQFTIDATVTNTGDGSAVDIHDGVTTFETNVGNGTYSLGPFTAGANITITVDAGAYGGCSTSSATLSESCTCSNLPTATINATNLNCVTSTYDIEVTVTSFGDGTAADIFVDGNLVQNNATLNNPYIIAGQATGSHNITVSATGGSFVSCSENYSITQNCTPDICSDAIDILGNSTTVDLTVANNDTGETDGTGEPTSISMGNGTILSNCGAGPQHSAYYYTDFTDLWYRIDIPNGSDEFTLTFSGLTCPVAVLPYTGNCGSLTLMNIGTSGAGGIVDADFDATIDFENGDEPFISSDGSIHFKGTAVATASTSPIYLRIIPHDNHASGTNCNASDINYCSFDIIATSPQPNDICSNALPIIDGTTYAPITQSGNISLANADGGTSLDNNALNGDNCDGGTISTNEEDLWYTLTTPSSGAYYLQVDLNFTGTADNVYVLLENYCASGSAPIACTEISSSGTILFDETNISNFGNELSSNSTYNIRILRPTGSNATSFTISAQLIAKNSNCDIANEVFPTDFTITSSLTSHFNFATASGVQGVSDRDLWYVFDPNNFTNVHGQSVYSTSADITVSGLTAGQTLDAYLYRRNGSSGNCVNYANDFLTSASIPSNGTFKLNCLDEIHGTSGTGDGYILRLVETAGNGTSAPTVVVTPSTTEPPFNNSCINIWNGSSPENLGISDVAHNFNAFVILDGETVSGDFSGATDCDPGITNSLCSGVNNDPFDSDNQRDMWYAFSLPNGSCPGLTSSSVIESVTFTYNAGSSSRDAKIYVYSSCGDANLIACSPTLDGNGDSWEATGLAQGNDYLIRIKPSSLNSNFDYSFDLTLNNGPVRPCNNNGASAEPLSVQSCNDYNGLPTWSMQGADPSAGAGVPENDVWFTFTAPSPANGSAYFVANRSWVTVFFEHVSGASSGPISMELYSAPTAIVATANSFSTTTTVGSQEWAHFGHLNPGQQYYLRLYHKDGAAVNVQYKINVYTPNANETAWECGINTASLTSGCSEGCDDLREAWFKIDLPEGTPSNEFYMIEVVGEDQILDFELRSQYISESSATEGDIDDFDLPCSSRPLEPGVSMVMETAGINSPTSGQNCNPNGNPADGGFGVRRVYTGMNGPAPGQKDFYYIKVFMDPSDPNYNSSTAVNICTINFNGPYSTSALANAGGAPDLNCLTTPLGVSMAEFSGYHKQRNNYLFWNTISEENNSHFLLQRSKDASQFETIATIAGNGTTQSVSNYNYIDHSVNQKITYYRLIQIDYDGTETIGKMISIASESGNSKIYPSPVKQGNNVTIESEQTFNQYTVTDMQGNLIINKKIQETSSVTIGAYVLAKGIYLIQTSGEQSSEVLRLVVN